MNSVKKPNHRMDLGLFAIGVCLIWMPTVSLFDLLPSYLGYLLMMCGLYRLANLNDDVAVARRLFGRMAVLSAIRLVSIPVIFGFISMNERPMMLLIATLVLGLFDIITLIPAWKKLGNGLIYLATRQEGTAVFFTKGKGRRNVTEKMVSASVVFFVFKEIAVFLPECAALTGRSGGADPDSAFYFPYLYEYIGLMRGFFALLVVIAGVCWLVRMWLYMRRLNADKPFFGRLQEKYAAEVMTRPDLFAKRRVKAALICMCVALAFSADLYLDNVNVLPDLIVGALLVVGLLLLRRYVKAAIWKKAMAVSAAYTVIATVTWILQLTNIPLGDFSFVVDKDQIGVYILLCVAQTLSRTMFAGTLLTLMGVFKDIIFRYTGFSMKNYDLDRWGERSIRVRRQNQHLWIVYVLTAISVVASVVYFFVVDEKMVGVNTLLHTAKMLSCLLMTASVVFLVVVIAYSVRHAVPSDKKHKNEHPDPHVREVHRELNRRLWVVLAVGILAAVTSVIYVITLPMAGYTMWEIWTFVDAIVQLSLAVIFIMAVNAVLEQMNYKYMLS